MGELAETPEAGEHPANRTDSPTLPCLAFLQLSLLGTLVPVAH